jgi:hypothetical protein
MIKPLQHVPKVYRAYTTAMTFPAELVVPFIGKARRIRLPHLSLWVRLDYFRLLPFAKSLTCYKCGIKGAFFALQRTHGGRLMKEESTRWVLTTDWHLNLYAADFRLMTCDHVVPRSKGGSNYAENLETLCSKCNSRKAARSREEFMAMP